MTQSCMSLLGIELVRTAQVTNDRRERLVSAYKTNTCLYNAGDILIGRKNNIALVRATHITDESRDRLIAA